MNDSKKRWKESIEILMEQIGQQQLSLELVTLLSLSFAADTVNKYLDTKLSGATSINRTGFHILHTLIRYGGKRAPSDISKEVIRSKHAVTRAVDLLEKERLVKRTFLKGDRRYRIVTITQKGLDLVGNTMSGRLEMSHAAMSCLEQSEQSELRTTIRKLRAHISALIRDCEPAAEESS